MVEEGLIDERGGGRARRGRSSSIQLLAPIFDAKEKAEAVKAGKLLGKGLPAGPGAASGRIAFDGEARGRDGGRRRRPVLLVRERDFPRGHRRHARGRGHPDDARRNDLARRGRRARHGKTCIVGAGDITVDEDRRRRAGEETSSKEGDWISIDGTTRRGASGKLATRPSEVLQVALEKSLLPEKSPVYRAFDADPSWADKRPAPRRARQRGHADRRPRGAPSSAPRASASAAPSTCSSPRSASCAVREMILADDAEGRRKALDQDPADAARGLRRHLPRDGRAARHDPPARSAAARVPAARARPSRRAGAVARRDARKRPERVRQLSRGQPDARPPRLPPGHHLSRDLRDAGPGDLRGGLRRARRESTPARRS